MSCAFITKSWFRCWEQNRWILCVRGAGKIIKHPLFAGSFKINFLLFLSPSVKKSNRHNFAILQLIGTLCGRWWAELFQSLVNIANSCDRAGTIANELPIVEQIPVCISKYTSCKFSIHTILGNLQVLHRLDHSIHTMRLWANTKAKELCSEWNMNMFFRLINNDMNGICLERLNEVKGPGKH